MECPKCGSNLVDDVIENIEITETEIYIDVKEIFKCTQCDYTEDNEENNEDIR